MKFCIKALLADMFNLQQMDSWQQQLRIFFLNHPRWTVRAETVLRDDGTCKWQLRVHGSGDNGLGVPLYLRDTVLEANLLICLEKSPEYSKHPLTFRPDGVIKHGCPICPDRWWPRAGLPVNP